jgi:hypothetical protein
LILRGMGGRRNSNGSLERPPDGQNHRQLLETELRPKADSQIVLVHSRYYLAENAENIEAGHAIQMKTGRGRLLGAGFRAQSITTTLAKSSH